MSGDDVRALLAAARLTERALAEWMGYTSPTPINRMARGERTIPPALAEWLRRRAADAPPRAPV